MTYHRYVYKLCLKNQVALPLVLLGVVATMMLLQQGRIIWQRTSSGKVLIKYSRAQSGATSKTKMQQQSQDHNEASSSEGTRRHHHASNKLNILQESNLLDEVQVVKHGKAIDIELEPRPVHKDWPLHNAEAVRKDDLARNHGASDYDYGREHGPLEKTVKGSPNNAQNVVIVNMVNKRDNQRWKPGSEASSVVLPKRIPDLKLDEMRRAGHAHRDAHHIMPSGSGVQRVLRNLTDGTRNAVNNNKDKHSAPKLRNEHKHGKRKAEVKTFRPHWKSSLFYNQSAPPLIFASWTENREVYCEGKFVGYSQEFAALYNVVVDQKYCISTRTGDENMRQVMNQSEAVEYYEYQIGCFKLACDKRPMYYFNTDKHLSDWFYSLGTHDVAVKDTRSVVNSFTIAITRYEYANIYHTMTDWYNAFLVMQYFNKTQGETAILLIDTHPRGALDSVWGVLFSKVIRMSTLPRRARFTHMVWGMIGYNSPFMQHFDPALPLIEEFRELFLSSFRIGNNHTLDCQALTVLFIWRRDYIAHPRNPGGTISRKIQNERELLAAVQKRNPSYRVRGIQLDLFDMAQQLKFVTHADVLIGMHGAGMTHSLFLPRHAALIELVPDYWSPSNEHFSAIANWRNLTYEKWVNDDPHNEAPNHYTRIPTAVVNILLKNVVRRMCNPQLPAEDIEQQLQEAREAAQDEQPLDQIKAEAPS